MQTLQKVAGNPNCPVPGQSTYQNDLLTNSIVHFMIMDNVPQSLLSPNPDFLFTSVTGEVDISPNTFQLGTKMILLYSKCECQ